MKKKAEIDIGFRAFEEVERLRNDTESRRGCMKRLGIDHKACYGWRNGEYCPSAWALQGLCYAGADIKYILTGKRG